MSSVKKDEFGNELFFHGMKLMLYLKDAGFQRVLGIFNPGDDTLYVQRTPAKHLLRKANAYGFNYEAVSVAKPYDKVHLTLLGEESKRYLIPNTSIKEEGEILFFKQQGFEKQLFMSMDKLKKYEINDE